MDDWEARRTRPWQERIDGGRPVVLTASGVGDYLGPLALLVPLTAASWFATDAGGTFGAVYHAAGWAGIVLFGVIGIPVMLWTAYLGHPSTRVDDTGVRVARKPYLLARDQGWSRRWDEIARFETDTAGSSPDQPGALVTAVDERGRRLPLPPYPGVEARVFAAWLDEQRRARRGDAS